MLLSRQYKSCFMKLVSRYNPCFWFLVLITNCIYSQNLPSTIINEFSITENLNSPVRIAIDQSDNIYVTDDFNKLIKKYDSSGTFLKNITAGKNPISIAINNKNELFVGDGDTGEIHKINANGALTLVYSKSIFPSSMVFDPENNLYITDSFLKQVTVLDPNGNFIKSIGNGTLMYPTGLGFDSKNNRIIVSEHGASDDTTEVNIYIFSLDGTLILKFGSEASTGWNGVRVPGNGQFNRTQGIAVSRCGSIYVTDPFQSSISIFNENGSFITKFGNYGNGLGSLNIPLDVELNSEGKIFITSFNNNSIEVYTANDIFPTSYISLKNTTACEGSTVKIPINFTGTAPWTFIYSINAINQAPIITSENPYLLSANISGTYQITSLQNANATGNCFTGSPVIFFNSIIPTASISTENSTICNGEKAKIDIALTGSAPWAFTYTVDDLNPTTITTEEKSYSFRTDKSGTYKITEVIGGGCTGTISPDEVTIVVYDKPTATVTNTEKNYMVEVGESRNISIQFTGTAPFTFIYLQNDLNPKAVTTYNNPFILPISEEGTYEIEFIEDAYCSNSDWQDYFDFSFRTISGPTATIAVSNKLICSNTYAEIPIQFTGTAPWNFTYTLNNQNPVTITTAENPYLLNVNKAGEYKVISLTDAVAAGTSFIGSAKVEVVPLPLANYFYEVNNLAVNFINGATNADSFIWNFGDGNSSTQNNPVHNYSTEGIYTVTFTALSNNCGSAQIFKEIKVGRSVLSGDSGENYKKYTIAVYPNPSSGDFTIKISPKNTITSDISIVINSLSGQTIYNKTFNSNFVTSYGGNYYINVSLRSFTKGIYFINIKADNYVEQEKLILK